MAISDPYVLPPYRVQWRTGPTGEWANLAEDQTVFHSVPLAKNAMEAVHDSRGGQVRLIYQHVVEASETRPIPPPIQV